MDTILTRRLLLRPITMEDAPAIFEGWAQDPKVTRFLTWDCHDTVDVTREVVAMWLQEYQSPPCYRYGITLDGKLIGMIDVVRFRDNVPEIGYVLSRKYWGQGLMTEACKALMTRLYEDGYDLIRIRACQANQRSLNVIRKCHFTKTHDCTEPLSPQRPLPVPVSWFACTSGQFRDGEVLA